MGAWIETADFDALGMEVTVAPLVGAWIETCEPIENMSASSRSHPSWVRGLKQNDLDDLAFDDKSHPSWVRGLKRSEIRDYVKVASRTPRGCVD